MKEKLIELLEKGHREYFNRCSGMDKTFIEFIGDYLIANGVTMREKGEWEIRTDDYDCEYAVCSACGSEFYDGENDTVDQRPNFCLECGADMRGEA